ncbi:MAG: ribosome hibernation-promoting factor, HPF/YfiA family [Nocardioidaceae bacterium]
MEIVVKGRHCEVSDRFREHVLEKLSRLEKYDHRPIRVDVEVSLERNPRLSERAANIELTLHSRGPVIRAEASAEDKLAALDKALGKLEARLRKAADRRRIHHGHHAPMSLAEATALPMSEVNGSRAAPAVADDEAQTSHAGPLEVIGDGPLVVREKTHRTAPMSLDQALYEMELVGHDFYLFVDADSDRPSVVYRRRGYDYGVIRLATDLQ